MVRKISGNNFQPANVQATEKAEAQSSVTAQPQNAEATNTTAPVASSVNKWQRASLKQDGSMKQSVIHEKLTAQQNYDQKKEQVEKNREAREDSNTGSILGTIFGGPLVGTFIGNATDEKSSRTEIKQSDVRKLTEAMQNEAKKLEKDLAEVYDNAFIETVGGWLTGSDSGVADSTKQADQRPHKKIATELKPKYDP